MNRVLISKLYQEAVDFCVAAGPNPDGTNKAWLWEEKFAELIVQECLDIATDSDMTELEGSDPDDVLYVACKQIKEHFGVENV